MKRTCLHTASVKDRIDHYTMVDPNSGCWLWTGAVDKNGYGKLTIQYRDERAHRAAYVEYNGAIPDGMVVCHKCDTPGCVRPDHLFLGTHADNIADRDAKGRHVPLPGELNGNAKMTDVRARLIKRAKGSQRQIGEFFGVCQQTVSNIKRGKIWAHV